ncbi:MAG TPA: arginine deiminase-related protein, partial [Sediminibacterium sp.]|nr:arginine deiminase-related protein [Sediminibacterium sp.]
MASARHFLMIRPTRFDFNEQTAVNNYFQTRPAEPIAAAAAAMQEFDAMVATLRAAEISVLVVQDSPDPPTPDAVFPNNWISFFPDGSLVLYPMFAPNRRWERKPEVMTTIRNHFSVNRIWDLSEWEKSGVFLEGTGSMVLDHENKLAYAALSPRTDATLLDIFCKGCGYLPIA